MSKQGVLLLAVGSFNPPTIMHLRIMELAKDFLSKTGKFHVVGGILSPVHDGYGKKDLVPSKHRIEMVKLALDSNNWIKLSNWEAIGESWKRTREVVDHHQKRLNAFVDGTLEERDAWMPADIPRNSGRISCKLVCGADLLESFNVPDLWNGEDILTLVKDYGLVVIPRNGKDSRESINRSDILKEHQDNIFTVNDWLGDETSSTRVRQALKNGESVRNKVLDPVIAYIEKEALYK